MPPISDRSEFANRWGSKSRASITPRQFLALLERIRGELPQACFQMLTRLRRQRRAPVLKVIFQTILSHQTTSRQTRLAIRRLWARYDSVAKVARAHPVEIEALINNVGISRVKARRLVEIAQTIRERWQSERRLAHFLRSSSLEDARRVLMELAGVGPKTSAVILLFRFNRPTFPVDTNILRVARELGWVGKDANAEDVRVFVERRIPANPSIHLKAHAYLLALGRATQRGRRRDLLERLRAARRAAG